MVSDTSELGAGSVVSDTITLPFCRNPPRIDIYMFNLNKSRLNKKDFAIKDHLGYI